jgi:hypothetical protein
MDAGAVENAAAVQLEIQNPVETYSNSYERDFKYLCSSKLSRKRILGISRSHVIKKSIEELHLRPHKHLISLIALCGRECLLRLHSVCYLFDFQVKRSSYPFGSKIFGLNIVAVL